MKSAKTIPVSQVSAAALFDTGLVGQILAVDGGIEWPDGVKPRDIHVERGWPTRDGSFVAEWSFRLDGGSRHALFATAYADGNGIGQSDTKSPVVTTNGIRGLLVHVPRWGVRIHSVDRDPGMPHLERCLDEQEMAERLSSLWKSRTGVGGHGVRGVECRPLSYRVGRRAAIGYRSLAASDVSERLMGKTYCDGRGERLTRLHDELDRRLASSTNGRVRVPTAVGYLSDLHLMLSAWVRGDKTGPGAPRSGGLHAQASLAADALSALHSESVRELPDFTLSDECTVITRWHSALATIDVELAEQTRSVTEVLLSCAESVQTNWCCTVHRDFYDGQFVYDGRTITLLDLDTLARGDPCIDLGNLLAHMFLSTLRASAPVRDFASAARLVLRRYRHQIASFSSASGSGAGKRAVPNRQTLAFYWASALFRVGAVHALRTSTGRYAPYLWQLAGELLTELPGGRPAGSSAVRRRGVVLDSKGILRELSS